MSAGLEGIVAEGAQEVDRSVGAELDVGAGVLHRDFHLSLRKAIERGVFARGGFTARGGSEGSHVGGRLKARTGVEQVAGVDGEADEAEHERQNRDADQQSDAALSAESMGTARHLREIGRER